MSLQMLQKTTQETPVQNTYIYIYIYIKVKKCASVSLSVVSDSLRPHGL